MTFRAIVAASISFINAAVCGVISVLLFSVEARYFLKLLLINSVGIDQEIHCVSPVNANVK